MTDDYSDHPKSITEIKADKSNDARVWTPRDALIDLLRAIDSGEYTPQALIVAFSYGDQQFGFRASTPDGLTALGLATRFICRQQEKDE